VRPRLALLLGALVVPVLPLLATAPAQAALGTICVGPVPPGTVCNTSRDTIQAAITDATSGDLIRVGPGAYPDGPYVLPAGVSLRGSGVGTGDSATKLTLPAGAQTYVTVSGGGTVADLRVDMSTGNGATGIAASGNAIVDNVLVFGAGANNVTGLRVQGAQVHDATVNVIGGTGNTAVRSLGGNLILSDSTWRGGAVGYRLVSGTDTVSRMTVELADTAVLVEGGTLNIDNAVLDLGTTGGTRGLLAHPTGAAATVNATHLTVVGGGAPSWGVVADATDGLIGLTLTNSIVRGPTDSLTSVAGGSLTVSRSDYQTAIGAVTDVGDNVHVDPAFVDPADGDYHLRATSPVVDKGLFGSALDRDSRQRFDGDKNGTAEPDLGAYELVDVTPPNTTITAGPSGATNDNTPLFTFRSGADATFECQLDGGAFQKCTSPVTTTPLPDGPHTFTVRATDPVFNVEANPPVRKFTVDTVRPDTRITKKAPHRFFKPKVRFKFTSPEPGVHFQCQLDRRAWQTCRSPLRYSVRIGKHSLKVRAVDAAGNVDRTPASYTFKRLKRHR